MTKNKYIIDFINQKFNFMLNNRFILYYYIWQPILEP